MDSKRMDAPPRAHFVTLGCAKNEVDTRDMARSLEALGIAATDDIDSADVVIINTCSFIQAAVEEGIDAILEVVGDARIKEIGVPVVVSGCMPSRYGDDLKGEFPEVSAFVPCAEEGDIADIVSSLLERSCRSLRSDESPSGDRPEMPESLYAYVKISDGCDRFCSYCMIPFIRGRYRSFTEKEIMEEVSALAKEGVKEIVLIGQDTGLWGSDLGEGHTLASLMGNLARKFPEIWFRAMYTQPENVTDELLETIAANGNIAPYLDIPMQHCSENILSSMNRRGNAQELLSLVAKAREMVPGIALRTTLMVGFPGETDRDFEELMAFVEDAEFEYAGIFAYSPEEGTKASEMDGQVRDVDKDARYAALRDLADSISNARIALRQGDVMDVMVEGEEEDGQIFGRSMIQAPEVDGISFIDRGEVGERMRCTIVDTLYYDMEGEVCDSKVVEA